MRAAWTRLPLRTRLTAAFAVLLLVGLILTGTTALGLLRRSLVDQLDAQLTAASQGVVDQVTDRRPDASSALPSDYQVAFLSPDGAVLWRLSSSGSAPADLPGLTAADVVGLGGEGFTVGSVGSAQRWRVLASPLVARSTDELVGSVAVALPMDAAEATVAQMRTALLAIGLAVVALGVLSGWWAVRRSLRPLEEIEGTAAAIAAGDLSRRVPQAPTSTEVGRLGAALNGMLAQIETAFAARTASEAQMRRFVADASHELRTPLATIRGYGELYRMGAVPPQEVGPTVARMEDAATRMGRLVQDLLDLARLDEGRAARREPVDLAVLAHDAAADLRALDPSRTVRVVPAAPAAEVPDRGAGSAAPPDDALVLGDEDRLRQVLANLVGNAAQHTPAGTPVEIAVGRPDAATVAVEVRDHGPGIDPAHAARVFERFYRVDAARGRDSGGTGLGLAIVAAVVAAHDGSVALEVTAGGGTTVRVALPAAGSPAPGEG